VRDFPDPWRDLGVFIREQREVARLSVRRLSDMAGISNPYLSQIERGLRKPSAEILQQIAKALRISAETLYVRAGILDPRDVGGDLTEAILSEPNLSEDQKQTLMRIYLSFRRENDQLRPDEGGSSAAHGERVSGPGGGGAARADDAAGGVGDAVGGVGDGAGVGGGGVADGVGGAPV
jgi:transcriptional regulator with XRE-family HTH domain